MEEIRKILQTTSKRKTFISNFDVDDLDKKDINVIKEFIKGSLIRRKHLTDIFELSLSLEFVTKDHLKICEEMLQKRASNMLKVTILDYLLIIFKKIDRSDFSHLNQLALKSSNLFVAFQAQLNLTLIEETRILYFKEVENFPISTFYYRLLNSLLNSEELSKLFQNVILDIKSDIKQSEKINFIQKKDFESMIAEIISQ